MTEIDQNPERVALPGERVRARKTGELLADDLRRRIVRGELREGDALPSEAELMVRFGVSRPTLREALRVLESESLITVRAGARGGPRVTLPDVSLAGRYVGLLLQLSATTIGDLFQARAVLEPQLVRMITEQPDRTKPVSVLRGIIDGLETVVDDMDAFSEGSSSLHRALIDLAGNKTLSVLVGSVWHVIEHHTATAAARHRREVTHYNADSIVIYRKLVDRIERGDADAAEQHWKRHMENFRNLMLHYEGDHLLDIT
jgi:DNA-binding FadR family transcriptional regulator